MTVIDRFEDNIAVLEADGEMVEIPREKLPAEAREGDILNFADGIMKGAALYAAECTG